MDEARSSWNTVYQNKEGFECQITLRDEDESILAERIRKITSSISKSGGLPLRRNNHVAVEGTPTNTAEVQDDPKPDKPEKTYVDEKGVRRCNLKLKSGKVCGQPVTERQGRYGPFWSCPDYKEHAM